MMYTRTETQKASRRNHAVKNGILKPCRMCGGQKEPGRGRQICNSCIGQETDGLTLAERLRLFDLIRYYGINLDQYNQMLEDQGGVCAICKAPPKTTALAVDHDHDTGKVRGLLCPRCNVTLEFWMENHDAIYDYLAK